MKVIDSCSSSERRRSSMQTSVRLAVKVGPTITDADNPVEEAVVATAAATMDEFNVD